MYTRTFTQEMIDDLYKMDFVRFSEKWKIDKGTASRYCKSHNIPIYGLNKGKEVLFVPEMISDLGDLGNVDFHKKWNISFVTIAKYRKAHGIKAKNNVGGRIDHKIIDGVECKWCNKKHWEPITNFIKYSAHWDKLSGLCKKHRAESKKESRIRRDDNGKRRAQRKDPAYRDMFRLKDRRSHSSRKHAHLSWIDQDEKFVHELFGNRCAYCGKDVSEKFEVDHFVPVKLGGLTEPKNMVLSCPLCNHEKNAKDALKWLTEKFGERIALLIYLDVKKKLKQVRKIEYVPQELL
jgi:hypothetical protein